MSSTMADRMAEHLKAIRKETNESIAKAKKDGRLSYGFTRVGRLFPKIESLVAREMIQREALDKQ